MGSIAGVYQQMDAAGQSGDSTNTSGTNSMSNTAAFLQLLVAQLKNQDPTNPMNPTTFVTQLAEFNDVQQNLGARQDLDALSMKYLDLATPPSQGGNVSTNASSSSDSKTDQSGTSGKTGGTDSNS
ncbi:MAG: flagellar hook capping FlgD N-terminal domain-containing protein [Terriglobia bacterium]